MNRAEQTKQMLTQLYGQSDSPLAGTDPEFAAIKTRLIYGEVYAEEKLSAKLRELVILVVATTNQTMDEVKRHTAAALANQKNIQDYLSAYCFGDFYTRKFLTIPERELLTFAVLSAQGGCEPQVKAHVGGNAAVGNGKETLLAALTLCMPYIGFPRTLNALGCINAVLPEAEG